jgi:hypothetical protein
MVIKYFISFVLIYCHLSYGQGYFPLQKGNYWKYETGADKHVPYAWEFTILSDDTIPSFWMTQKYSWLGTYTFLIPPFIRQDNSKVNYIGVVGQDVTIFDFSAKINQLIGQEDRYTGSRYFYLIDTGRVKNLKKWTFIDSSNLAPIDYTKFARISWDVVDSIGIVRATYYAGNQIDEEYHLKKIFINGVDKTSIITSIHGSEDNFPKKFTLYQNYPNPFNPITMIEFSLSTNCNVRLNIIDNLGREITNLISGNLNAGRHKAYWQADNMSSGVYYCRLIVGDQSVIKKIVLLR